ncbi:MAG TPA: hypothetical protein DCK83_07205 [Gallionellaceae bacterium]|nr:hypothetical protein [Gallionellaceae bacterium]
MKITIIDGQVGFNGVFRPVQDAGGLLTGIHAVQFDTVAAQGHIEKNDLSNVKITDMTQFQPLLDAWLANAPTTAPVAPKTFDELKADKSKVIVDHCDAACVMGFISNALGTAHLYPSKVLDQQNLNASVVDSLLNHPTDWTTPHMCQDVATGVWAYRPHAAAQIQQAGSDVKAGILGHLVRNAMLQAQIAAIVPASAGAADVEAATAALDAVVWA